MNYFLVDYENVNVSGFDGISKLTENDTVIIFYSDNANTMTFGLHRRINEAKANLQFQKVETGKKNSLDFQLCSYLGHLICDRAGENSENNYYIVSNDLAYVTLADYWKKRGADVTAVKNLTKAPVVIEPAKNPPTPEPGTNLERALATVLKNKQDISEAVKIIKGAKTKTAVNNGLGKKFGTRTGGEIYRAVKNFIADKA